MQGNLWLLCTREGHFPVVTHTAPDLQKQKKQIIQEEGIT